MSDRRRRWSPESSRRRRKAKRDSRGQLVLDEACTAPGSRSMAAAPEGTFSSSYSYAYSGAPQSQAPSSSFQYQTAQPPDQQPLPEGPGGPITMRSNDDIRASAPMPMPGPSRAYERERDRRRTRRSRHGSRSSSDALSLSSSSSSSYLDISRWYPSFGRSGGVLKTFFNTPSERKQRLRRRRSLKKKNRGIFGFGNNSSSSSVNSDMAYGMGFVKKPRSRNFSPRAEHAAGLERSDGRPAQAQRRQTDEEILEIGRKLAKVARDSNREDMRAMGKRPPSQFFAAQDSWDRYSRQNIDGHAASSRGVAPSRHDRHDSSSSDDDEWESASEGEYSSDESHSGLAYGSAVDLGTSSPLKSSVTRQSTIISARPPEDIRPPDRKSSAVDPRLFGPVNSLRGLINTPCGFGDRNSVYTVPGPSEQRYAGSAGTAESASIEARPLQNVYPVQTSDPARMDAARASGSLVSSVPREPSHSSWRPEPIPIQAPKPIAPVPTSMYDEQRIRDTGPAEPRDSRIRPSENKTFAETALVGAGVAALGAAIMAGRDKGKGKGKEKDGSSEPRYGRHERYGHDDHREEGTVVQDSRRAKELALEKEIERLERVLADRNKARQQRKRDSKRDIATEPSGSRANDGDAERDQEKRRRDRDSRYSELDYDYERPDTSRRVSEPSEQPAVADDSQTRRTELPAIPSSSGIDVFQFQVPDDAFRTRDSPLRTASPMIIDVTPAPSPPPDEVDRRSRRDSFEDERRDAKHIYDESMHSTAPISAVDMAAAIAATDMARRHEEPERGRTLVKTQDLVQEEANAYYHARRMAEREVSSRSRSKSAERSVVEKYDKEMDNEHQGAQIVRIVTPPEMMQKPQKHKYSEPNADFRFDRLMSPKDLDHFRPQEYQVRDPSAERPRPYLNLVIPTPVPTPTPEIQKKKPSASKSPEPVVEEPQREGPDVVISPRGEVFEAPQTPTSKRVSWGPSETQQYDVESPDRSSERNSRSYEKPKSQGKSSGWGPTAAAFAGIAAAAALSKKDDEHESSRGDDRVKESTGRKSSEDSRSPPSRKVLPKGTAPSRVLDEEPEDVPPAPGPKPASPRSSQMPGAFADDLDFAATLAAGLQDTGFDPNIVIDDAAYRRRDSPPGSNEHTGVYMHPYSETVTDLGAIGIEDGSRSARQSEYVIGELADTPASEKGSGFDWAEDSSRRQSKSEKRRSVGSDKFEVVEEPKEESPRLSKKEQRKLEKAARSAKLAEEEERASQPAEGGEDVWEEASTSRKSKRTSKKSKRASVGWDDADTPVNDRRVSVPIDAFDDLEDSKPTDVAWEEPQKTSRSKRDSEGYDMAEDHSDRRERRREERRRSDFYEPLDREVASVVSETRHDDRLNGRGRHQRDDERSVVSAPDSKRDSKPDKRSSKEEKRSSGGFWGLLKGSNGVDGDESKKDNAGTLGAGAGLAGAVAVASLAAGSHPTRSDAAEAPSEQEETQHVIADVGHPSGRRADSPSQDINVFDFQDPDITPRVIKPAIDPQYGDLLPLPPSPTEEEKLYLDISDDLPSLPDSRPATPPGQEKLLPRDRSESSQKRPSFATHSRRRSAYETPLKSPSHTAIPISFRMGQRSSIPASPRVVSNPTSAHQSPAVQTQETFSSPSNKRSPRPPSWDRPTSWDSTREIKPLYLIERSAHASGDAGEQQLDDRAENTPLPPSRESPAPESEAGGDVEEEATRDLETSSLFVDTAVARSAPLGSQESTPKGFMQTVSGLPDSAREFGAISKGVMGPSHVDSGLPRIAKDGDTPPIDDPRQSPLLESSYATPIGFASPELEARSSVQQEESTESVPDFSDALDRPAVDENIGRGRLQDMSKGGKEEPSQKVEPTSVEDQNNQGYFSSAFSMLPAAGLAGVGALLGRGKRDDTATTVDENSSQDTHQSPLRSPEHAAERSVIPEIEAIEAVVTSPSDLGNQGQAPLTAGADKSGPDTPLATTGSADASVPNDSPAAHMRLEEVLPISDLQHTDVVARDVEGLEPEREALTTEDTRGVLASSSAQPADNDLTPSPTQSPEDMETIIETPADTVDWPEERTSKKKKGKKGKKKRSNSHIAPIPATAEPSTIISSDVQQGTSIEEASPTKTTEGSSTVDLTTASSSPWHQSDQPAQDLVGVGIGTESDQGVPKGEEPESSTAPYHVLDEGETKGLTENPKDLPDAVEVSAISGTHSHSQSQDEESQVSGSNQRSPSTARRLRSSRSSMSPHDSADRYGSPDAFQSGDDVMSPRSASASARSSTGQKYKKTRSLRSSRRSSLASQGSGQGNEAELGQTLAFEQPGTSFDEHTQKTPEVEQHSPQTAVDESVTSPLEVVEQQSSSPLDTAGERGSAQTEFHDESEVKAADVVNESASAQPEPFTGESQRLESPIAEDSQRGNVSADKNHSQQESAPPPVDDTSPTSSQKDREGSARDILAHESLTEAPDPPGEPALQENLPEMQLSESLVGAFEQKEPGYAVHDDLPLQAETIPSVKSVEQAEEVPGGINMEQSARSLSSPISPRRSAQAAGELEEPATQVLPDLELQNSRPIAGSSEYDDSFITKKNKKNKKKKRKSSTAIGGTAQSSGTATPAELELSTQPAESSVEPSTSHQGDDQLEKSFTVAKDTPLDPEQLPASTEPSDPQNQSKQIELEGVRAETQDSSWLVELELSVAEGKSSVESIQASDPIVLPALDDIPAEIGISEVEKPDLNTQEKSEDTHDEDEIARREAEADQIRDEEAEISRLQSKKKLKPKEKTRLGELRANADRRAEEATAVAEAVSPPPAEITEAHVADSSTQEPTTESQFESAILPVTEGSKRAKQEDSAGPNTLVTEALPLQAIPESAEAASSSMEVGSPSEGVASQPQEVAAADPASEEILLQQDESITQTEVQPEVKDREDLEEIARREAEAALIRDEEAELARLESKRKPNKKDKVRMKVLKSKAERLAHEPDAAAQPQIQEQVAADLETPLAEDPTRSISQSQVEDNTSEPISQEPREARVNDPRSLEDAIQTSDKMSTKDSTHPFDEDSSKIPEHDSRTKDFEDNTQVQSRSLGLSQIQTGDSPDEALAGTKPPQTENVPAERAERQIQPDVVQPDSVQIPQIHIEDTTAQLDPLADESHAMDTPPTQPRRHSQPQVEEAVTDPVEAQCTKEDVDMPETQIEGSSQAPQDDPLFQVKEGVAVPSTHTVETSQAPAQEPALISDISQENDKDNISIPAAESEQPVATVLPQDPESEWPVLSKKSEKDEKKKRKGTISDGSSQNSGTAIPSFDAGEESTNVEPRGLPEAAPVSSEDMPQSSSFEEVAIDRGEQPGANLTLRDDAVKDLKLEETTAPQPFGSSIREKQEPSLGTEHVFPATDNSEESVRAITSEPDQVPLTEEPESVPASKKSKKDKKKKRKNTVSDDSPWPSGSATPTAVDDPEQPYSLTKTTDHSGGGETLEEHSLPLDVTEEPVAMRSTTDEFSAAKTSGPETVEPVQLSSSPQSVTGQPSTMPSIIEEISTGLPETEPEQAAQDEAESFITKKSKKDRKRKKTLSGTVTSMRDMGEAFLPSGRAEIQEHGLEATQKSSSPLLQPSEPEETTSNDLVEDISAPPEQADVRSPSRLAEIDGPSSTLAFGSEIDYSKDHLDQASRRGRKSDGWGFLAGAITGASVAAADRENVDKSFKLDVPPETIRAGQSPSKIVETNIDAPSPLDFADVVETARLSHPKDQGHSQATDDNRDLPQSLSIAGEERSQSVDIVQEPEPIQEDTLKSITPHKESQDKESTSLDLNPVGVDFSSTQRAVEKDTKQEDTFPSGHSVQEPRGIEQMIPDLQESLQEEPAATLEPEPQVDNWTQASSSKKKKKKKDKKRKGSVTPWSETESFAHTTVTEEPSEAQNVNIGTNDPEALEAGDLTRTQDDFAMQPKPGFKADNDESSAILGGAKIAEQSPSEDVSQPEATDIAGNETTTPVLHRISSDHDDTFTAAEDPASESIPSLARPQEEIPSSETISNPMLDLKADDRDEARRVTATTLHGELPTSPDQMQESADRSIQQHHEYTPDFDPVSTEAFETPMELPVIPHPWITTRDGQALELSGAKNSSNDNAQIGSDLSRSLDLEPEPTTSVPQVPTEPADAPAGQNLEPAAEDFLEPIPKKLSKKEKRKAKKGSVSIGEPEITARTPEGDSQQISKEPAPVALDFSSQQDSQTLGQLSESTTRDVDNIDLDRSLPVQHTPEGQPDELSSSLPIDNEPLSVQSQEEQPGQARAIAVEQTPVLAREMSKKEKRKAKKAATSAWEDDVFEPSQPQESTTEERQVQDMPTPSSPVLEPESGQKEATQAFPSAEPRLAQEGAEGVAPSAAKDATAEDEWAIPISRKKSKKDKKNKGKQSSSGSVSGIQTPAVEEGPISRGIETAEAGKPIPERSGVDQPTGDISGPEGGIGRRLSETYDPVPDTGTGAHDPFDQALENSKASQGRKDHRSAELYLPLEGANDEVVTEPSRDASAPSQHRDHRSAEFYVPEKQIEAMDSTPIEDDWDIPIDDGPKNDNKASSSLPGKTPILSTPMGEARHLDKFQNEASRADMESSKFLRSPDGRGKELEKMQPSPDLWDDEDYFKPKPDDFTEPIQEPFTKFDIHPAVARGFAASPDRRVGEERPLVGLGLIHRHSSIFQEDDGHKPKLLTMTSDNLSTDSVAVQETEAGPSGGSSQLGGLKRSITVPARPSSSRSYRSLSPSPSPSPARKDFGFYETGPAQGSNVPLARSVSPDKSNNLRPVSPGLPKSPQFAPREFRSVSPDKFNNLRPVSPGLPSPGLPSPGLPKSPQYPPRESSSFEDTRDLAKKGSVAALAERFGGSRKATGKTPNISTYVGQRNSREDDLFDEPAMWEGAERKPFKGSHLDVDSGDSWAFPDTDLEGEQLSPDTQNSGQGAAATSHGREPTTPSSDNVSEPRSQPDLDSGAFTPQIPDQANREAEIPLESVVVESPVLGSQPSVEFPTDERQPLVESPHGRVDAGTGLPESNDDVTLREFLDQPQDSPAPRSRSPDLEKMSSFEELGPTIEKREDDAPVAGPSVVDFSRSLPRVLPSVQEEPHEEEAGSKQHGIPSGPRAVTPDINRDSGVVTGSPVPPRVHQFESAQPQRDSGVHMRDPATPILEAQDAPITPEPRKNKSKSRKYPDLGPIPGKAKAAAALAGGGGALLAASAARSRSPSPSPTPSPAASQRSVSDVTDELRSSALPRQRRAASSNTGISRTRTPEPLNLRAESPSLLRHSGTPPLRSRRTRSGDLRSLSQLSNGSHSDLGAQASSSPASAANPVHIPPTPTPASSDLRRATTPAAVAQGTTNAPTANEGRVRSKDMADVYDGFGEGRLGSPRSPTRPHSMRRRQSMQVLELENRVEQLIVENRALQDARAQAETHTSNRVTSTLAERDTEIEALKQSLDFMRKEVQRLTEVNEGLNSAIQQHAVQHDDRYRLLETQHAEVTRELFEHRDRHGAHSQTIQEKDAEIQSLREQLEATKEQIREMQKQILATKPADSEFLRIKDVDYFDHRCQQLCSHVQQWVLRFSKFSDMRACRLTSELNDEKIIDRLDNAVLDGSNVDHYLNDRVRRRDVFMSVTMTMIWEFVFTRYLFGMDREQRQKLKNLEKLLLEVGPPQAVRQWRAVTLTLLSKREPFKDQRDQDTEAVVQAVFQTLSMILPPPSNLEDQIQGQLRKVMREAVDLSVEMRTQRAEYMMLPPLQPDYDANGDLAEPHPFNSALMNERSGDKNATADNDALEAQGAVVRVVLFPLVVKKGDDDGVGDDEIVVCPAQVIVARPRSKSRQSYRAPSSDAGGVSLLRGGSPSTAPNRSNVSMADAPGMAPGMEGAI
ncbi:hypothetical protein diail_3070 [Diaporthe ilicicola]|nr:hypothetical protein diail_3070 [Diaporthe ilicicola]